MESRIKGAASAMVPGRFLLGVAPLPRLGYRWLMASTKPKFLTESKTAHAAVKAGDAAAYSKIKAEVQAAGGRLLSLDEVEAAEKKD